MAVRISRSDAVAVITIDRPDALNAVDLNTVSELRDRLGDALDDRSVRCVVLTGAGEKAFVAGADVKYMEGIEPADGASFSEVGFELVAMLESMPKPTIAAINGFALGGGLELALACDFRYASASARLGQPEVTYGLVPGWGATQRLARTTSLGFAKELIYTGRIVDAEEALRRGLVDGLADPVLEKALETGRLIAQKSTAALAHIKRLCNLALQGDHAENLRQERLTSLETLMTADAQEGLAAYVAGRRPNFANR
jgi:enoyl-CoA hydratase